MSLSCHICLLFLTIFNLVLVFLLVHFHLNPGVSNPCALPLVFFGVCVCVLYVRCAFTCITNLAKRGGQRGKLGMTSLLVFSSFFHCQCCCLSQAFTPPIKRHPWHYGNQSDLLTSHVGDLENVSSLTVSLLWHCVHALLLLVNCS